MAALSTMGRMNATLHHSTAVSVGLADNALNIMLVYEDFATGMDAMRTLSRFIQRTGLLHEFSTQNVWRFETLAAPALMNIAATEAANAEMIIVAAHGPGHLPVAVMHWIELWLGQRKPSPAALVALLDGAKSDADQPFPIETYLKSCACRGGMDFFVEWVGECMAVDDYDFAAMGEKAEQISQVIEQIMQRPQSRC